MAAQETIPVYTSLNDLYQNIGTTLNHAERWSNLTEEFVRRFGRKPAYIARAPGRVKPVPEGVEVADEPELYHTSGSVIIENLHHKYPRQVFAPSLQTKRRLSSAAEIALGAQEVVHVERWHLDINPKELRWESYVKAGYYGVLDRYFSPSTDDGGKSKHPTPVDLLVTGTVPAGSGLSSSAAMVVASTLSFLAVNGKLDDVESNQKSLTKGELVLMAMENEKRVGVNSGGLDQAASVICQSGSAIYITFFPALHASPIPLPPGAVFVCANSLVVSDKAVTAKTNYNLRVVETLVGARLLARLLRVPLKDTAERKEKVTYREVIGRLAGEADGTELPAEKLAQVLGNVLTNLDGLKSPRTTERQGETGLTIDEMIEVSGLSEVEFTSTYLSWIEVEATYFQIYKRAKHVFSEALRVLQFRQACLDGSGAKTQGQILQHLGELMNDSQSSCADLFQCSCPELDELTQIARDAGALGSRLTGAGWGGCTVSLVPEDIVDAFIDKVKARYGPYTGLEGERLNEVIFATKPSSGACVFKFED
ncbi:hypothetical protein ONZ45_g16863 [Pleurotus djamor]|nr:hypothetical protein ONZ45_g16863 [Pleurotus djamor]